MNKLYEQLNGAVQSNVPKKVTPQDIIKEVQQSGMSARDLFFKKAKEMGIDPNSILAQLR